MSEFYTERTLFPKQALENFEVTRDNATKLSSDAHALRLEEKQITDSQHRSMLNMVSELTDKSADVEKSYKRAKLPFNEVSDQRGRSVNALLRHIYLHEEYTKLDGAMSDAKYMIEQLNDIEEPDNAAGASEVSLMKKALALDNAPESSELNMIKQAMITAYKQYKMHIEPTEYPYTSLESDVNDTEEKLRHCIMRVEEYEAEIDTQEISQEEASQLSAAEKIKVYKEQLKSSINAVDDLSENMSKRARGEAPYVLPIDPKQHIQNLGQKLDTAMSALQEQFGKGSPFIRTEQADYNFSKEALSELNQFEV